MLSKPIEMTENSILSVYFGRLHSYIVIPKATIYKTASNWIWWCVPLISALGRKAADLQRGKHRESQTNQGCIVRHCLKINKHLNYS